MPTGSDEWVFRHTFVRAYETLHRALCCLFRPDTDGTRVSKCGQLSQQTRRLDPMLFQCWSSAIGGGPILKQHWVKCSRLLGSTQVSVYTHPSATIIFSPADQGTFSKTAGQSQAYYNTWNWERGTYDVNHLHILTCEGAVSRVSSVTKHGYTRLDLQLIIIKFFFDERPSRNICIITLVMLSCLLLFVILSKLELLTQFPASNDEK